jgi:hypothetical protein
MQRKKFPVPDRRHLIRPGRSMQLRIESSVGYRDGSNLPTFVNVEWAGRVGHPSSYGLLGGTRARQPDLRIWTSTSPFKQSSAGSADQVFWGLPAEYEDTIERTLADQASAVSVGTAAHGMVGSSNLVFMGLTTLLCRLLGAGIPINDDDVWRLLDSCWSEA